MIEVLMMKMKMKKKHILPLLIALLIVVVVALALIFGQSRSDTEPDDFPVATVNGEELLYNDYIAIESAYLYQMEAAGADLSDSAMYTYFQDLALTYAIEQMLVKQDMRAQGCYDFDKETEAWFAEQGKAAYDAALADVMESMRDVISTDKELREYALAYAKSLNVTEQTYVDFYRTQYASANYYEWLIRDNPITDEDVKAAYDERIAESKALYEDDIAAFETAMTSGAEVWYKPAGYRSILQILLPAQGDTAEAKLQSVQSTVDEINTRLAQGESFQSLIAAYGTDANFADESFLAAGYQVHQDSIMWDDAFVTAAFSAEMAQPGSVSLPFASDLGVHILYYLCDSASGPVELTADIHDFLAYTLYTERYTAAQAQRINELADAAEVVIY